MFIHLCLLYLHVLHSNEKDRVELFELSELIGLIVCWNNIGEIAEIVDGVVVPCWSWCDWWWPRMVAVMVGVMGLCWRGEVHGSSGVAGDPMLMLDNERRGVVAVKLTSPNSFIGG